MKELRIVQSLTEPIESCLWLRELEGTMVLQYFGPNGWDSLSTKWENVLSNYLIASGAIKNSDDTFTMEGKFENKTLAEALYIMARGIALDTNNEFAPSSSSVNEALTLKLDIPQVDAWTSYTQNSCIQTVGGDRDVKNGLIKDISFKAAKNTSKEFNEFPLNEKCRFAVSTFNLIYLVASQAGGGGSVKFYNPACKWGEYGSSAENNGILITDKNGNIVTPTSITTRYRGETTSITTPSEVHNEIRYYLPEHEGVTTASFGHSVDVFDLCVHICWSNGKDFKYVEQTGKIIEISNDLTFAGLTTSDIILRSIIYNNNEYFDLIKIYQHTYNGVDYTAEYQHNLGGVELKNLTWSVSTYVEEGETKYKFSATLVNGSEIVKNNGAFAIKSDTSILTYNLVEQTLEIINTPYTTIAQLIAELTNDNVYAIYEIASPIIYHGNTTDLMNISIDDYGIIGLFVTEDGNIIENYLPELTYSFQSNWTDILKNLPTDLISLQEKHNKDIKAITDRVSNVESNLAADEEALSSVFETMHMYGVRINPSTGTVTRIGNEARHQDLPAHRTIGGLLKDDGTFTPFTNQSDWTNEIKDGSQGQVMVEFPDIWWKCEDTPSDGIIMKWSAAPITGYYKSPKFYCSAYEATVDRNNNILSSVKNTTAQYRGCGNQSAWDDTYRDARGLPATAFAMYNGTTYAQNRNKINGTPDYKWNQYTYMAHWRLTWMFVIEFANLNSQTAVNHTLTPEGYHQGGLGSGVSNINSTKWSTYNSYYPFVPCGYTDTIGTGTGEMDFTMPYEYDASDAAHFAGEYDSTVGGTLDMYYSSSVDTTKIYKCIQDAPAGTAITNTSYFTASTRLVTKVNKYRGIEMPFGHTFKWVEGVYIYANSDTPDLTTYKPKDSNTHDNFILKDTRLYTGSSSLPVALNTDKSMNENVYTYVGGEVKANGNVNAIIGGVQGYFNCKSVTGTAYYSDYHYQDTPSSGSALRALIVGGYAHSGSTCGLFFCRSHCSRSISDAAVGFRLCYHPSYN